MNQNKTLAQDFEKAFREIVNPFIKYPEDLEVKVFMDNEVLVISARSNFADHGKILGTGRKNFDAIQEIMGEMASSLGFKFRLNRLLSPVKGEEEPRGQLLKQKMTANQAREILEKILKRFLNWPFNIETFETADATTFIVTVSKNETLKTAVGQLGFSLSKIFNAIGWIHGHKMFVKTRTQKVENATDIKS